MAFGNSDGDERMGRFAKQPSEHAAPASDGKTEAPKSPWGDEVGPTVVTDKPPQGRFSGVRRQGCLSEMAPSAAIS
jgi:hypothetical protein